MARTHGKLFCSIWNDRDFRALDRAAQGMYAFLVSQDRLDYAGVLQITLRSWASAAADLTVAEVENTLDVLEKHRFVIVDRDTEELMIRTFVRRDELWRQPKMMLAVVAAAQKIQSPRLRLALLTELDRLPLHELPNEPTKSGAPPARQVVTQCVETLRRTLFAPDDDPGSKGRETQSDWVSQTESGWVEADSGQLPVDGPVDNHDVAGQDAAGNPIGLGMANPHAGARAHTTFNFQLSTTTTPSTAALETVATEPGLADADKPRGTEDAKKAAAKKRKSRAKAPAEPDPEAEARDKLARDVVAWWWERLTIKPAGRNAWFASLAVVKSLLEVGWSAKDVANAARIIGSPLTIARMEIQLNRDAPPVPGIPEQRLGGNVLPFQRPGPNDAHLAAAMERAQVRDAAQATNSASQTSPWKAITG
jgi:hypothetical protein